MKPLENSAFSTAEMPFSPFKSARITHRKITVSAARLSHRPCFPHTPLCFAVAGFFFY